MSDAAAPTPDTPLGQLTVQHAEQDGAAVVALTGELDLGTVSQLDEALSAAGADGAGARVCVDLSALEFIDSTGLAAIIRAHVAIDDAGGRFVVVAGPGPVRRTFTTTGVDGLLALRESRETGMLDLRD